jgi:3-deoxy-D-manno-octulosonic-acid transferase
VSWGSGLKNFLRDVFLLGLGLVAMPVWFYFLLTRSSWHRFFMERLKCGTRENFDIWVHGASLGEIQGMELFLRNLHEKYPRQKILITCNTLTGRDLAKKKIPWAHVQLAPLDWGPLIFFWTRGLQPKFHILSELDIWPARQHYLKKHRVKTFVLGARLSEEGFLKTRRFWFFLEEAYRSVHRWLAREEAVAERLKKLGIDAEKIEVSGPLKYDGLLEKTETLPDEGRLEKSPVVVAGSVHPGEVAALLPLTEICQLVLVPRHLHRLNEIEALCREKKLKTVLWTSKKTLPVGAVLLVDATGILARLYEKATVAFVGGTLLPKGGHNVMEPLRFSCPVVIGPYDGHIREEVEVLKEKGGIFQGENVVALIEKLLQNPELRARSGRGGRQALEKMTGGVEKSLEMVARYLTIGLK